MRLRLHILAALPFAALLSACLNGPSNGSDPGPAKAAWQSNRPDRYSYRLERACFCVSTWTGPFLVEAEGGSVVRVRRVERGLPPDTVEVADNLSSYSVDSVFAWVERMAARDNYRESVEYDPVYGFPAQADFDHQKTTADDEMSLTITEFRKN